MTSPNSTRWEETLDTDENTLLMTEFSDGGDKQASPGDPDAIPPSKPHVRTTIRRTTAIAVTVLVLVLIYLALLPALPIHVGNNEAAQTDSEANHGLDSSFVVEETPRTRIFHWTVSQVKGAPVGITKPMIVVNGKSPGPAIEANLHDRIIVYVRNDLEGAATSIHWHGLYQNGTNYYDGSPGITQCGIPPGNTLAYNFTLDGYYGTTWWHGHTDMQDIDGLFGPIVIHNPKENVPSYDEELLLTLSDVYNTPALTLLDDYLNTNPRETIAEPVPDAAAINGIGQFAACSAYPDETCSGGSYFNLTVSTSKTYRLRLINTGALAPIIFSVDSHTLTVVEADGTPVVPFEVDSVTIQPAQRYSALLKAHREPRAYWMRARMDQRMFAYKNPSMNPEALGFVRYDSVTDMPDEQTSPTDMKSWLMNDLVPADPIDAPSDVAMRVPWTFSIQRTSALNWRSFINGTSWEPLPIGQATLVEKTADHDSGTKVWPGDQLITSIDGVQVVDFVINNLDDGDHPFHLHGYKPWIMGSGAGRFLGTNLNTTNPMRRDTFLVPAFHWMVIRLITDTPGYWAFHCHIAWHMAAGALFQVVVQSSVLAGQSLPEDIVSQCRHWL